MKVEVFAKKVGVCLNPNTHMFTMMVQFGEHDDEMPYPTLVEMSCDTALELRKKLGVWLPMLQAKIENRHSTSLQSMGEKEVQS